MATETPSAPDAVFAASQTAYERGRAWHAAFTALPLAVIPLASFAVGRRLPSAAGLGVALLLVAAFALWRGQGVGRGFVEGLKGGLVPLVLSHAANLYGHVCTPAGCTSLCVPACVAGGLVAGAFVGYAAARSSDQRSVLLAGAVTACLVGAFGCACVGMSGIVGMIAATALALGTTRLVLGARAA